MNQPSPGNYDSEFCGNLPIHLINVIQPYGAILVYDKQSRLVIQLSENCSELFGQPAPEIHGQSIDTLVPAAARLISTPGKLPVECNINGQDYLVILHEKEIYFILEINLQSARQPLRGSFLDVYQELRSTIREIEQADSVENAARITATELKKASGFDKVMVYRFDTNWNGYVIAEACEEGMETYLGFTFPASDIPRQARELYLKNAYRFIPDVNYEPVKLYPFVNPATQTFIDMSDCNVRGVTSVHIEYLRNMQVQASMSTRIIKDGKLWGLIACHHREAMEVNYKMCAMFELLSGIISARTSSLDNEARHSNEALLTGIYTNLIRTTYRTSDIAESLLGESNNLLDLFAAGGAVLLHNGRNSTKGAVPDQSEVEDLLLWLHTRDAEKVFATNSLSTEYDYAEEYKDYGSGLIAIPIDKARDEYILLFRPEVIRLINWGGDPGGRINYEADMKTYHPRFSFKLWQEQVRGVAKAWTDEELGLAENLRLFIQEYLRNSGRPVFN